MPDHSEEELKRAANELEAMTPEEYLNMTSYIERLERGLPELASRVTVKMFSPRGFDVMFSIFDVDDTLMYKRLTNLMTKVQKDGYTPERQLRQPPKGDGSHPEPPASEKAAPEDRKESVEVLTTKGDIDVTGPNITRFEVQQLQHLVTPKPKEIHYLLVKGGRWMRWGWRAWPEVVPDSVRWQNWEVGAVVTEIPLELRIAYADQTEEHKKVIAFAKIA